MSAILDVRVNMNENHLIQELNRFDFRVQGTFHADDYCSEYVCFF